MLILQLRVAIIVLGVTHVACHDLRLLGLLPMTGEGWTGGRSCLPAIQMAIEDINVDTNILQGYNLTYKNIDSKCSAGTPVYRMFEALNADPPYNMLLGDGCSVGTEATARVSHLWNLTQFSFGSSSPVLSDRKMFPAFYRMVPPDQKHNPVRIALMNEFGWKKVATINQALEHFSLVIDDFVQRIQDSDITILSQEIFLSNPLTRVQNLKEHDARIIMTSMYEDMARAVLCAAYKVGLYGPKIVWVFNGWYSVDFWRSKLEGLDCTVEQMSLAAEGAFLFGHFFQNPVEERGVANLTYKEFDRRFKSYPTYTSESSNFDFCAGQCYDHIWVLALAFNCTIQRLQDIGHPKRIEDFTYSDSDINEIVKECMSNTTMTGVSGRVVFNRGSDPDRMVKVERIQGGQRQHVGTYRQDTSMKQFEWIDGGIKWKNDAVPRDSTYVILEVKTIPLPIFITITTLAGVGVFLVLVLLCFNIYHRNNKIVKMSSPNINNVLLLGCVLCYCTVFLKSANSDNRILCKAEIFCFSTGFTLTFGALFAKTWRVYRIFTNKALQKLAIRDGQLFGIIFSLVALVVTVIITWECLAPHHIEYKPLPKEMYMVGNDAEVHPLQIVCQSEYSVYFGWALYTMQGALLSFGAFLAWETRHVKIEALNDSHEIGICLYNVVVLSALGLTISLLLEDELVLMYGITSGCLIIGTTFTQVLIFAPKVHSVYFKKIELDGLPRNNINIKRVEHQAEAGMSNKGFVTDEDSKNNALNNHTSQTDSNVSESSFTDIYLENVCMELKPRRNC